MLLEINGKCIQNKRGIRPCYVPIKLEVLFHLFYHCLECVRVIHGKISQHLTVQTDTRLLHFTDKLRIRQPVFPDTGVDPLDPHGPELSFLLLSVAVGVNQTFFNGVLRYRPYILLAAKETFGKFHDPLALSPGGYIVY